MLTEKITIQYNKDFKSLSGKYKWIVFILYYILFSGVIYKIIHIPTSIALALISAGDILPLLVWIIYNPTFKLYTIRNWIKSADLWIIAFLIILLLFSSDIRKGSNITTSIIHFGALIRYIPLSILVADACSSTKYARKMIKQLNAITTIILLTSWLSVISGQYGEFLLPVLPENNTSLRELQNGYHSGIFVNTIDLGFLLDILFAFKIFQRKCVGFKTILILFIFIVPTYYTGSAASSGIIILIYLYWIYSNYPNFFKVASIPLIGLFIALILSYSDEIIIIYEVAKLSRLGVITIILPYFLKEFSIDTFLGIGTNIDIIYIKVNSYPEKVHILEHMYELGGFGDVYWVALIIYHGVIGFLLFVFLLYAVYKCVKSNEYKTNILNYKCLINTLFGSMIILGFFNQVLVVKSYSLIFWTLIGFIYSQRKKIDNYSGIIVYEK